MWLKHPKDYGCNVKLKIHHQFKINCNFSANNIFKYGSFLTLISIFTRHVVCTVIPINCFYRTVDDDVEESVTFELLDDDHQWIRTTNMTCCGANYRCNPYRI